MASRPFATPAASVRRFYDSDTGRYVTWSERNRVYVDDRGQVVPSGRVREVAPQTTQNVGGRDEASRSAPRRAGDDQPRQGTSNDKGKQPARQDERHSDPRQPPANSESRRERNTNQSSQNVVKSKSAGRNEKESSGRERSGPEQANRRPSDDRVARQAAQSTGQQRSDQDSRIGNVVSSNTVASNNPQQPVVRFQSPNTAADSTRTPLSSILSGDSRPRVFTATDPVTGAITYWEVTAYQLSDNTTGSQRSFKRIRASNGNTPPNRTRGQRDARTLEANFAPGTVVEAKVVTPPHPALSTVTRFTPIPNPSQSLLRSRYFVIVEQRRDSFLAVAIKTYSFQGVAAEGVTKAHHAIIYTQSGKHKQRGPHPGGPPEPTPAEMPRQLPGGHLESGMQNPPIRVKQVDLTKKLDPMSRVDYTDRWEFDYGVSHIRVWGQVHRDSRAEFRLQYEGVWAAIYRSATGPMPPLPGSITLPLRQYPGGGAGIHDQRGPGTGKSARSNAVAAPSRDPRTSAPRTPAAAVSGTPAFQVPIHARPNSGPITEKQCTALLQQYRDHAVMVGFTPPSAASATIQQLASDSRARANFLTQVMDWWHQEAVQRQARQQPALNTEAVQRQIRPQPLPARQGRGISSSESSEYTDDEDEEYYHDRPSKK
ncbi:hypothetical protein BDY17DRAFT_95787 [Neohortaea acidophila]|uniref:DUF6590 domain-containing protein n=1 Tax=Neohortaea acidophila TaxID=245834 RepID=A0A6A6PXZ3_9PEZI|nr:uncharacterized protein BDY17DRAFT_95787 [Neohortaea acidophila]KAF2485048.1 hypothetical protein BDY17DRAFT_95787 [Neohortaea acidophila]